MNTSRQIGLLGEKTIIKYAVNHGMEFITSNYHSIYGEIDIICRDKECISFIEVKARRVGALVKGLESVNKRKQIKIIKTACLYLQENDVDLQPRFDIADVEHDKGRVVRINYIKNAFGLEDCDEIF